MRMPGICLGVAERMVVVLELRLTGLMVQISACETDGMRSEALPFRVSIMGREYVCQVLQVEKSVQTTL